ncbi:MAG: thermonuclease family protein [Pseudomonadota bacterium]
MRRWTAPLVRLTILILLGFAVWIWAGQDDLVGEARIIDGDSIEIGGADIRLYGIDAPEFDQTCLDRRGSTYACGRLAKRHLERAAAGTVTCEVVEQDRYGRDVSICFAGEADLGAAMVSAGWARAYLSYSLRYATEEQSARDARRGLWDGEFDDPWAFREDGVKDDLIAVGWRWLMENWRWVVEQVI